MKRKLKNDKYRKARGGKAFLVKIFCTRCSAFIMVYQKDGDGALKRCYLNRIFSPKDLSQLQHDFRTCSPRAVPALVCRICGEVIGRPIKHRDGRIAFKLRRGVFFKKRVIE